jgi:hypothetical protein
MTKVDAKRIGKNFGYFLRSLSSMSEDEYCYAAKAVLEHHFDNHEHCRGWCKRRNMSEEEKQTSIRFYRSKENKDDAMLYEKLSQIVSKYITLPRLIEVAHGMDTNCNESLNNTISYFSPKNRVFCGSRSLHNRVAIAVGIVSLGFKKYYERLLKALGHQRRAIVSRG